MRTNRGKYLPPMIHYLEVRGLVCMDRAARSKRADFVILKQNWKELEQKE
jgi:hypothetical protein